MRCPPLVPSCTSLTTLPASKRDGIAGLPVAEKGLLKPSKALLPPGGLMTLMALGVSLFAGCATGPADGAQADANDSKENAPTMIVTGSRIPHKVPGGRPQGVKTISREGFEEDMRSNQMPHRQGG